MAVLGRLLIGSQQRIDLADFLSIQSYVSSDFRELIRSFVGSNALVLKGFEIINAPQSIGTTSVSISVADSVLYDPTATAGSFFSGLPEGNALSQPIVLGQELRPGATNYVYLTLSTTGAGQDTRAFWDVDLNGGAGGEFNQTINTEGVLIVEAGVSTAGFPQGTIPIARIGFSSSAITDITDCRNLMYRLGSGGTSPDPNNRFQFPSLPSLAYARSEPPSTINSAALPNPFQGGDKNIQTLKEWMDVVMTKLVELSGTTYWYESTGDLSLVKVYDDALGSSLKSKGKWTHDETVVGQVAWSEDITYSKMNDPRDIIVRAGSKTLTNNQVMWIKMVRNQKINALDTAVTFINGASYVNGAAGSFQYLNKGDWIKQKGDSEYHYARVVDFYITPNGSGTLTNTPSDAVSVKLEGAYTGSAGVSSAVYTKGDYKSGDVRVNSRDSLDIYSAGGDMYWLATRLDTIQNVGGISVQAFNSVSISQADGTNATVTFGSAHGLVNGDRIVISNASLFNGTYPVEVADATSVSIQTSATGSTSSADASWAVVNSTYRNAAGSSFEIESDRHGFASGQKVTIAGVAPTTPYNINGDYLVNVRNVSVFQIPYSGGAFSPTVANATATCAKVILKTNLGSVEVVQGETININEPDTQNLMGFIGMGSLAETKPVYVVPDATNNMVYGYTNFNSDSQDSLTTRVSRLTAMMADRVQDRDIIVSGRATFRNTTSGANQILTISGDNLTIAKPGSASQTVTWSSPYSLAANTALVVDINRNSSSSISPSVVPFDSTYLLKENRFVLLYRNSGTEVYSWNSTKILNSSSWTSNDSETGQNRNVIVNEQVSVNYDGTKLNFNSTIGYVTILVPGTSTYNRIDVSNFTSGIVIGNDQSAWVRINRWVNKTFTNRQTSATYQDSDIAGSVYITSTSSVPTDQDVIVLYSIQSGVLVRHHAYPVTRRSIYEEYVTIVGNQSSPIAVPLPVDSRNGGVQAYYISGSGQLEVALNGQIMKIGEDYIESAPAGSAQSSITFIRDDGLVDGDIIRLRLATEGGFYTIDVGTTTTLQQAYNQGQVITTINGSPVTVAAGAGYKALQVNGDLGVTGVIDPTGLALTPQAANPLGSDHGIWVDLSGNLNQARPGNIPSNVNITQSITNPSSFLTAGDGVSISTATISASLDTNSGLEFNAGKTRVKLPAAGPLALDATGVILNTDSTSIEVSASILGVKADPAGAVVKGASGIGVNLEATNPTLQINTNQLGVKLDAAGAVVAGASGVGVQLETTDPGLKIASNKLDVKLDAARAVTSGASGVGINLNVTNPGLAITANALDVKLDGARAITSGASGVGVNLETVNPTLQVATNQLGVKLDAAGAIVTGANGLGVAVDGTSIQIQSNQLVVAGVPNLLAVFTNNTGTLIPVGAVVAADTVTNQIALATASTLPNALKTIGVAYQNITDGTTGQVQIAGVATVATSSLTVGQAAYLSTVSAGVATGVRPTTYGTPVFSLGTAVANNKIVLQPKTVGVNASVYQESDTQVSTVSSGATLTLPVDSRASNAIRYYTVGAGFLTVYLNGQKLLLGDDYLEVGTAGTDSNQITIQQDLDTGDVLEYRIDASQALFKALSLL